MSTPQPTTEEGPLRVSVTCHGQPLPDTAVLVSARVQHGLEAASTASLVFQDDGLANPDWPLRDGDDLAPGAPLRLCAGFGSVEQLLFNGTVLQTRVVVDPQGTRLEVLAQSELGAPAPAQPLTRPVARYVVGENVLDGALETVPASSADATRERAAGQVRGRLRCVGHTLAAPGAHIELAGWGRRYDGQWPVHALTHTLADGDWTTELHFGQAAWRPAVLVNAPDQVLTLRTPAGLTVVLDDAQQRIRLQDQHMNEVQLDMAGLTLSSGKDVKLTAQGDLHLVASGDLTLTGQNLACDARMAFSAKGAMSAELSAAGETVVRGAMVMIN